jgi:hypothetical protein
LTSRVAELEQSARRLSTSAAESAAQRAAAVEALHSEREALRGRYDRQLQIEADRLRQAAADDVERTREIARENSERECRTLRESRDAAGLEVARLRREVEELRAAGETQRADEKVKYDAAHSQQFEQRMLLATKASECLRAEVLLKESEDAAARAQSQVDALSRKLDILKSEFYDLRVLHNEKVTQLENVVTAQQEKLRLLDDMELEAEVFMTTLASDSSRALETLPASRRQHHLIATTRRATVGESGRVAAHRSFGARRGGGKIDAGPGDGARGAERVGASVCAAGGYAFGEGAGGCAPTT